MVTIEFNDEELAGIHALVVIGHGFVRGEFEDIPEDRIEVETLRMQLDYQRSINTLSKIIFMEKYGSVLEKANEMLTYLAGTDEEDVDEETEE